MTRRPVALDSSDPTAAFATELRALRDRLGNDAPTIDDVSASTAIPRSTLYAALRGLRLPSRKVVIGLVQAWKGDEAKWLEKRSAVELMLEAQSPARGRSTAPARSPTGSDRGWCPLCGAQLGTSDARDPQTKYLLPPSLMLEVAGPTRQRPLAWRLTVYGTSMRMESAQPVFVEADVRWTYMLCGNGHYFLDAVKLPGEQGALAWPQRSFVAAIGPVASGKSYLLARTLNQPLAPSGRSFVNDRGAGIFERFTSFDPLEAIPNATLGLLYSESRLHGRPIPATIGDELIPGNILRDFVAEEIPDAAKALQEKVMKRSRSASDTWGRTIRQPVMLRTRTEVQPSLTFVADMAGELFRSDDTGFTGADDLLLLRNCSALLWVIDPFHSDGRFEKFLSDSLEDKEEFHQIAIDSSRSEVGRDGSMEQLREEIEIRDEMSERLAAEITKDSSAMFSSVGPLRNLIAISKCDLIERVLRKGDLSDLGEHNDVRDGIASYLEYLLYSKQPVIATESVQRLLDYLRTTGLSDDQEVRVRRVNQVADALLAHYSEPDKFWHLVHTGQVTDVLLRDQECDAVLAERSFRVPSIDEHLASSMQPGGVGRLQMRDLVMSAMGCGMMFGLGHERHVNQLLRQRRRTVLFFLCSPLGAVPRFDTSALSGARRTLPSNSSIPRIDARSAALTQLQLHVLREAMP